LFVRRSSTAGFAAAYVLVALFNLRVLLGLDAFEGFEKLCGVEGFKLVVGVGAVHESGRGDDDNGHRRVESFDLTGDVGAGKIVEASVENDSANGWKTFEGFERLSARVCGDDVESRGLNDEFAGRDASGKLPVNDKKTRSDHAAH